MADIHVEEFYRDVAIALSQLYSAFPRRINLFVEDIAGPDEPDEFGLHSKRHMACFGALLWLAEEGFLRYVDTIRQEALDQAVLTRDAFIRLSSPAPAALAELAGVTPDESELPPSVRKDLSTYIHLIRQALRSGHSERIGAIVRAAFFSTSSW
ncbi:hypothetical protein [Marinobacter lutaoensis]|jgi:hypothetical protein|uniref:Uncharacterized protein n=1 Tax=Marinobacter lutaoensis TaxID=135739 RepID=A0A1V2DY45_9GAMM|nr:hypothetical protein [Marinobacter lutaoensis]MBE02671.1 hypothetical protein [Marinobacter sp.]MBI42659.1 hypothetical protein [Oceanospirillales bacterium]NVD35379.1 hypothetical protein [Marinobacter lutaoensis]ONF45336.1 hypothetical protein BTO32_02445 [Marinobacter lutaoensis]|tara:strand:- start:1229 stop:1690 length:462 start_codon:yes stop_codon:yes gene_type:complete